jgi:ABC-2 type transport system permease protein
MQNVLTIAGKETRLFLTTWTSYILFGVFSLITAFFFQRLVIEYQYRSMQLMQMQAQNMLDQLNLTDWVVGPLLMNITVFFLFMLPMLTMRLLSEERSRKTLELLMTAPVRPIEIVLGKYLAAVGMMAIMLALTAIFPLLLNIFGSNGAGTAPLDWRSVGVGYAGMFLLGCAFIAVGLFTSAITESQVVAVMLGFATLLMFYVIGLAGRGESGFWQQLFEYLSISTHLEGFVRGLIRTTDLVYYASIIVMGLFLTYRVVEAQRWR